MRKKIKTVLGEIEPSALGLTSMDDALFYDGSAACLAARKSVSPDFCPREWLPMRDDDPVSLQNVGMLQRSALLSQDAFRQTDEKALEKELRLYKAAGGQAILSLGSGSIPRGLAAEAAQRLSASTGVHIVQACDLSGAWGQAPQGKTAPEYFAQVMGDLQDAPVMPGHLTISLSHGGGDEDSALRAAARAAAETGLSLTVRLCGDGRRQTVCVSRALAEAGLSPERVVLAGLPLFTKPSRSAAIQNPSSVALDTAFAQRQLDSGYHLSVCFENAMGSELAGDYDCGDFLKFAGLYDLVEKGYCKQLVLGNGCRGKIMLHTSGGEGYCRLLYYVAPMLRSAAGLSEYAMRQILVENPARILAVS